METDIIRTWIADWGFPAAAAVDLTRRLVTVATLERDRDGEPDKSEAYVDSQAVLEAEGRSDVLLFRNNVGALKDDTGRVVRYGLLNESARINRAIKSGDRIGIYRKLIKPEDVGTYVGQFLSIEMKKLAWKKVHLSDPHEAAQAAWAALINNYGGIARFHSGGPLFIDF